jgi:uncharacterized membrane protein YfcA
MPPVLILLLTFVLGALAWFLSTIVAGGAASLLLPILVFILGSQQAAPTIAIAALVANPTRAFVFAKYIDWKVIRFLLPGTCLGAVLGAYGFTQLNSDHIKLVIGIFLISTIFQDRLENAGFSLIKNAGWFLPLGAVVAFISGIVGAIGPVYNPFLISYGLTKENLIATKAFNSFVMQAIKVIAYSSFGAMNGDILIYGLCIGIGGAIGVILAKRHLLNMDNALFKKIMYIFMPLLGCVFIYQSL